jgi:tRNA(Arg) A34 adenosine deaminase TadA
MQAGAISSIGCCMSDSSRVPLVVPSLRLPSWVGRFVATRIGTRQLRSQRARMDFAIALANENSKRGTGGPFGAAIFERDTGRLVAVGVNAVVSSRLSFAHAEMLAIALAQRARRRFDLADPQLPAHELVTSSEPCAMCFGAACWSGVRRIACGARASDAEAIGFDEGPKPRTWVASLERRGISVVRDLRRAEAVAVLRDYAEGGSKIYVPTRKPVRREVLHRDAPVARR